MRASSSMNKIASAFIFLSFRGAVLRAGERSDTHAAPERLTAKAGKMTEVKLSAQLKDGYHANSNNPSDEYLIPMRLTWTKSPLDVADVLYPAPQLEKYSFSEKPLSVYTGTFEIVTKFKVDNDALPGPL